jgi:hypothetical protein
MDIAPDATTTSPQRRTLRRAPISSLCPCRARPSSALPLPPRRLPSPVRARARTHAGQAQAQALMEVGPTQQRLGDSFSRGWLAKRGARAPSLEHLVADADLGHSFGSSRSSFIDMDPAALFSMRWTATAAPPPESDFEFGLIIPGGVGGGSDPPSPALVSASRRVIRDGRLVPGDPLFCSARSAPASPSPSPCCGGRAAAAGRRSSWWKMPLQYLRFLLPLYRKVRALRRLPAPRRRPRVAPASPARASASSLDWCHGNADTAVRDAILYCKKCSVRPWPLHR